MGETGLNGAAVGIGGLSNAFGFKLDTYHNTSTPNASAKAKADPSSVAGGGAFGAFVTTDSYGVASTYTSSSAADNAAKLMFNQQITHFKILILSIMVIQKL